MYIRASKRKEMKAVLLPAAGRTPLLMDKTLHKRQHHLRKRKYNAQKSDLHNNAVDNVKPYIHLKLLKAHL